MYEAIYQGERAGAFEVPHGTDAYCPECDERVRVWREADDGTARHFKHVSNIGGNGAGVGNGCGGGESDEHRKWKNFAGERLQECFPEANTAEVVVEKELYPAHSDKQSRSADTAIMFETRDPQLRNGLAVEVQHKNKQKDIVKTTLDYIKQDVAVAWLDESDFSDSGCRLNEADFRQRAQRAVWPEQVPDRRQWTTAKYSPSHLSWENNGVDRYHLGRFDVMSRRNDRDVSVSATLPEPVVDKIRYQESDWSTLFTDYAERHFRTQAAIPRHDSRTSVPATIAERWLDTKRYNESAWASLFRETAEKFFRRCNASKPEIEVRFPREYAHEHEDRLLTAYQRAKGEYNFDLCYELSDNNAPRRCANCGDNADFYVYQEKLISEYRCKQHVPTEI